MFCQNAPPNAPLPLRIVSLHSKPPTTTPPILSAIRKFSANSINAAAPAVTAVTAVTAGHLCSWLQAVSCRHFHSRHSTGERGFPKEGKSYLRRWNVAPFLRECCLRPPLSSPDSPPPTAASWGFCQQCLPVFGDFKWLGSHRCGGTVTHCTALHCTALHCNTLHCNDFDCTALHCTALHCTALHCTALYCTALHCTALHCTVL